MNEVTIPLKLTGISAIKAELKDLKGQISNATDPEVIAKLSQKAGELADKLKDVNEQISVFNTGSKFEAVSNSFGLIQADLASLDFEGASEKAQTFAKTLGSVGKAEISGAIKGLAGTIKNVGGAFVKLGVQILANPLFLLAAIVAGLVIAFVTFLSKMGLLEKAFNVLMAPINALIDAFKRFTDEIGLSNFAAEENAKKLGKANEKAAASSKKRAEQISDAYDIEIAKAKAAGKDTTDLEVAKSKAISKEAEGRLKNSQKEYAELQKIASKDNLERRKKLREQIEAEKKILKDGNKERQLLQINDAAEQAEKEKENAKKRAENAKAYAKNRLDAERTIKDIEIALIEDDAKREEETTKEKYRRLIEDVKKNENLKGSEKVRLTALYESQAIAELDKAAKTIADAEKKRQADIQKAITDNQNAQLQREEDFQEQYRMLVMSEKDAELDAIQTKYFEAISLAEQFGLDTKTLEEKRLAELKVVQDKYTKEENQKRLDSIEKAKAERDAKLTLASDIVNGISTLGNAFIKDQKKLEQFNKASALVQIGIDTAKAISALVAAANSNPFNGISAGAAGIAQFASGIIQITTNIAKAKQLLSNPSGNVSGGGGGSTASSSSSAAALVPQVNLFGQGNNLNTAGQLKSANATPSFVVQAVVSETDITNTQSKINKIKQGSEL